MGRYILLTAPTLNQKSGSAKGTGASPIASFLGLFRSREMGVLVVLAVLIGAICLTPERALFLAPHNLQNMSRQIGLLGIFAVGECIVIITAGIDLSVGSLIGLSGVLCSVLLINRHWSLPAAFLATILLGLLIGTLHAFFITAFHIPPFVITLGSLDILRSAAQLLTNSTPIQIQGVESASALIALGNSGVGPANFQIPTPFILLIVIVILAELFMRKTTAGRHIYSLGGSEEATRLSGVRPAAVRWTAYMISSGLAALAGIVYAGYINEGSPETGGGYELNAIASAVIGGCSLFGGQGSVTGTVIGAALLQVMMNAITLMITQNSSYWQGVIVGCVVVIAVMFNELRDWRALGGIRGIISRLT